MLFAQIYTEDLLQQLKDFLKELSQESFFNYHLELVSTVEAINITISNDKSAIVFSYGLHLKFSKQGKASLTVKKLELQEDAVLMDTNPLLHDAGLLEMLLYSIRVLIFVGNFFNVNAIAFRILQEEADLLMYFNKIFSRVHDIYTSTQVFSTFKMVLNTGLEQYFIARQENMMAKIYQHLWSLQKSDKQIRQFFQQQGRNY